MRWQQKGCCWELMPMSSSGPRRTHSSENKRRGAPARERGCPRPMTRGDLTMWGSRGFPPYMGQWGMFGTWRARTTSRSYCSCRANRPNQGHHLWAQTQQAHYQPRGAAVPTGPGRGQRARDRHAQLHTSASSRSEHAKFTESRSLKQARRAAHATAPGQQRRQAWKDVHKQLRRKHSLAERASQHLASLQAMQLPEPVWGGQGQGRLGARGG